MYSILSQIAIRLMVRQNLKTERAISSQATCLSFDPCNRFFYQFKKIISCSGDIYYIVEPGVFVDVS